MGANRKDISIFLTPPHVSVREAMKQLDKCTERVLFVVDNKKRLLGSLTDGDLRRWILAKGELESTIENIYNKNPFFWTRGYDTNEIQQIMTSRRLDCIPVIDAERKILELLFWDDILGGSNITQSGNLNIPVVIMAGGKGTRMAPFTYILPKPLIPIKDKTILEIIIERFQDNGIKNFHLVLNYKGDMIKAYLKNVPKNYRVKYWYEKDYFGTAGGLKLLENVISGPFIVSNCDIIVNTNYEEVFSFHKKNKAQMTILSSMQHYKIPYGVIQFKAGGSVEKISEKPEYTFAINTGVYILDKECFDFIPSDVYFDMNNLIETLIKHKKKVMTYPVNESDYVDIGQWEEYKKATEKLNYLI
jgi:dTDP-glucose pyrophosphorylase